MIALDPDNKGAVLWDKQVVDVPKEQQGTFFARLNGIVWGGCADDENVYYGLQSGGIVAVKLSTGEKVWYTEFPKPPRARTSNSSASTEIPGVVFVAGSDGKLHAVATSDGHILWDYDTAHPYDTVNKVPAHGGGINAIGPTIVNGMLFVGSGYAVVGNSSGNVLIAFSAQ